ncbi:MAG: hypothetical protein Q7S06_02600 [Nanoarchaeota archaeon]|nr:hypothetical protein [Nanoarchaeota archaeon]
MINPRSGTTDRMQGINDGDLVEITLKSNARVTLGAHKYFVIDKVRDGLRLPTVEGRTFVGYVSERTFDSVTLCSGWNKTDMASRNILAYSDTEIAAFRFEAIEYYSRLAPVSS